MLAYRTLQLPKLLGFRLPSEDGSVDVLKGVSTGPPHEYSFAIFFPFENRTGTDAQFTTDLSWHGYLTLGCDSRLR